jgi:hypothetical protein
MIPVQIAQVAHEVNRAYCASIGDDSQPAWADAPDWQRASALAGVDMHLANPDATPEQSHESWLAVKLADGWTYGEVKNAELKQHPCFMPYADLPAAQKSKDYLFRAVVHAMAGMQPPEAPPAPASVAKTIMVDSAYTPIRYIGKRDSYTDGAYQSRITWARGESKPVPKDIAAKLLQHPDQYDLGDPITEELPPLPVKVADDTENRLQDVRDSLQGMTKAGLMEFTSTNYRVKMDKNQSVSAMRAQAIQLVDQFGVV